jgi:plasmid stabilization system protein ParE
MISWPLDSGPVPGHSLFTGCLIEGLTHHLGQAGSRVTTRSELGLYLQRRVESYPNSRQTPDFGAFDFDDRGEMVIPLAGEQSEDPTQKDLKPPDWSGVPQDLPGGDTAPHARASGVPERADRGRHRRVVRPGVDRLAQGRRCGHPVRYAPAFHIRQPGRPARHVLFYRIGATGTVEIVRLLYDAMDFDQHLP